MTENEAIKELSNELRIITGVIALCRDFEKESDMALAYWLKRQEAMKMAVQALEEIQECRAVGTAGECRAAVEKIKTKKPAYEGDGYSAGKIVYDTWICPGCGKDYEMEYDNYDYCPNCGQAIDWGDGK